MPFALAVLADAMNLPPGFKLSYASDVRWLFLYRWREYLERRGLTVVSETILIPRKIGLAAISDDIRTDNRGRIAPHSPKMCFRYGLDDYSLEAINFQHRGCRFQTPAGFLSSNPWSLGNFGLMVFDDVSAATYIPEDVMVCGTATASLTRGRTLLALLGVWLDSHKFSTDELIRTCIDYAGKPWIYNDPSGRPRLWTSAAYLSKFMQHYGAVGCTASDETELRSHLGFSPKGQVGTSEEILFREACSIFGPENVKRHYRGKELDELEIDVWIPRLKIGFEYQGEQHFRRNPHWHGEFGFELQVMRDQRKVDLCKKLGYHLMHLGPRDWLGRDRILSEMRKRAWITPASIQTLELAPASSQ